MRACEMSAFVDGEHRTLDLPPVPVVLDWLISGRIGYAAIDGVGIAPKEDLDVRGRQSYPRLLVTHHAGHGIAVLLLCWDGPDLFVCTARRSGKPAVYVFIPPNIHELWPKELFVPPPVASRAIEHALTHSRPDPNLFWIANGDFTRGSAEAPSR